MSNKQPIWKEWPGSDKAPVSGDVRVLVGLRDGSMEEGHAHEFEWSHGYRDDIVRYAILDSTTQDIAAPTGETPMNVPGYEDLADVLHRAYIQAAVGKGRERHSHGEPFGEQVMQDGARRFGVGALLFQAFKKSEEAQRLPHERAVAELLGAINYLAGAVIRMERDRMEHDRG